MTIKKLGALPTTVGGAIDLLKTLRDSKRAAEAVVAEWAEQMNTLEVHIFKKFGKQQLDGARGKLAQCSVSSSPVPVIEDWDVVYKYIFRTKALDLLERRMSVKAWRDRLEAKKPVPGTSVYQKTKLTLTSLKKMKK